MKDELEKTIEQALKRSEAYKTTKDGSYNAALNYHGYFDAKKKLEELLKELDETE